MLIVVSSVEAALAESNQSIISNFFETLLGSEKEALSTANELLWHLAIHQPFSLYPINVNISSRPNPSLSLSYTRLAGHGDIDKK